MIRIFLLIVVVCAATAQTFQARISGLVTDPQGSVVPGAELVATNRDTGISVRARSNEAGVYVIPFLAPGVYAVSASAQGFKSHKREAVTLETGQELSLDISLEVGSITESVTVTAEAPMLESSNATIGQVIDSRTVSQMPLNARRSLELIRLSAGVVFIASAAESHMKPFFSVAGGRVWNQMFWLDGGNVQNMRLGAGQVDTDPPVELIREFRVIQNNYSAEYGGSAGGVIVSTTKSGTNSFHGSAYEYFRNDALDAAGFFAPVQGTKKLKAPLRYNQFGFTLGGPIIRNRTHFFVGYEGLRRKQGSTRILTVPTALQRAGDFSQTFDARGNLIPIYDPATTRTVGGAVVRDRFAGNIIPSARFDRVARQLVGLWPAPNKAPVNLAGAQNFEANFTRIPQNDFVFARVDHAFSDKNRFYARYFRHMYPFRLTSVYPAEEADPELAFQADYWETTYFFSDTHTFNANLITDLRYTYGDRKSLTQSASIGSNIVDEIGLSGVPSGAFPAVTVPGFAALGSGFDRAQFPIRQHQIVNGWTWVRGSHVFKFGGETRKSLNHEISQVNKSGAFAFAPTGTGLPGNAQRGNAFASFLLGFGNSFSLRNTEPLDRYSWYLAGYLQDDWRVSPSLTLNLGVRWETDTPIIDRNSRMNGFDTTAINPVSGTPGVVRFAGVDGWPREAWVYDWNNFAPRIGFAWRPLSSDKWVVRGGYGIFYDHPMTGPAAASLGFESSADRSSPDNGITPAFVLGEGISGVSAVSPVRDASFGAVPLGQRPTTNVTFYERNRRAGYAHQFNLGIQRQLSQSTVLEVSYLGNLGRKLSVANLPINQVPPDQMGPGNAQLRRPYPQFNNVSIVNPRLGVSNYHAGMMRLEKRFSFGLNFLTTYTWSRNIGNTQEASVLGDNQTYQDFYNRRLDKGPSGIDVVHRFTWSSVYDLPFGKGRRWLQKGALEKVLGGWTFGTILGIQSGAPFTVTMLTDTTNAFPAGALRANVLRDPNLPSDERRLDRWFDTAAFQAPAAYTFGNAGRGIIRSDGRFSFDSSVNKSFYFADDKYVQIRAEMFNTFNHPDFFPPNHVMGSPAFGTVTAATDPRAMQLGVRIVF